MARVRAHAAVPEAWSGASGVALHSPVPDAWVSASASGHAHRRAIVIGKAYRHRRSLPSWPPVAARGAPRRVGPPNCPRLSPPDPSPPARITGTRLDRLGARGHVTRAPSGCAQARLHACARPIMRAPGRRVAAVAHAGWASRLRLEVAERIMRFSGSRAMCTKCIHRHKVAR